MNKYRAFSAYATNSNTPESDKLPKVPHVVMVKLSDGSMANVRITSSDPITAIDDVNNLTDEQFNKLLKIKRVTTTKGAFSFTPVPKNAVVHKGKIDNLEAFFIYGEAGLITQGTNDLVIGLLSTINEDAALMIVSDPKSLFGGKFYNYIKEAFVCDSAIESFNSLLKKEGVSCEIEDWLITKI